MSCQVVRVETRSHTLLPLRLSRWKFLTLCLLTQNPGGCEKGFREANFVRKSPNLDKRQSETKSRQMGITPKGGIRDKVPTRTHTSVEDGLGGASALSVVTSSRGKTPTQGSASKAYGQKSHVVQGRNHRVPWNTRKYPGKPIYCGSTGRNP